MHAIVLEGGRGFNKKPGILREEPHLEQAATVCIHVGPGVLGLALLQQDWRHHLIELGDQPEERVIGKMLQSKLALADIARVGLAQHGMPETRHHLKWMNMLATPTDPLATPTCPLLRVFHMNSLSFSLVTSVPISACSRFNHTRTSWLAAGNSVR